MPQVNMAIGNTHETITRPVVFGVVQDCLKQLGFDQRAHFTILGYNEAHLNKDNVMEKIDKNFFGTDTTSVIEITETPRQEQVLTMNVFRPDELCVFRDETSNLYIRPVKQMTDVTLNFQLRFSDKGSAMKWRDDISSRASLLRHDNFHRIVYSYPIPEPFMEFLYECHGLIANVDSSEPTDFADWFFKHSDQRMTTLTNVGDTEHMVIVPETQVRVLGYYDFSGVPDKPVFNKDSSTWTVEWSYHFIYDKVIECVLWHDLLVRQQLIPERFLPKPREYDTHMENNLAMSNRNALADYTVPGFDNIGGLYINREPQVDTWFPWKVSSTGFLSRYTPVFIGLSMLSEDKRSIVNLRELGGFSITEKALDLIEYERQYVTTPFKSLFNISIFSDDFVALPSQQTIDSNLNLKATLDLSPTPCYRVVISVINHLGDLDEDASNRYRENACMTKEVLDILYPTASEMSLLPRPDQRCRWTHEQWQYIIDLTNPKPGQNWQWGWPPRVAGVDGPPRQPNRPNPNADLPPYSLIATPRSVGLYQIIGRRP